ncbi:MAG: hypothetical protein ACPG5R_04210 [Cognaticolwellia aestuarii]
MKIRLYQLVCLLSFVASVLLGCTTTSPKQCGIDTFIVAKVKQYNRGPVNGGYDENHDGKVDHIEAFSSWDFSQLERVLHSGIEHKEYFWVNIDTCYQFHVTADGFYEDKAMPVLYQTCRDFTYSVYSPEKILIGNYKGTGCRHFTDHKWEIL